MIYTITLNPAIDKAVTVENFKVDKVNRVSAMQLDPGGKGINVSKMISNLGGLSTAIMVAGGYNGKQLEQMLDEIKITYETIPVEGETRINVKMFDPVNQTFTDINEKGPLVDGKIIEMIDRYLEKVLEEDDILILAGSIPAGAPADIYRRWCNMARIRGAKVILDAESEVLRQGVKGKPLIIKPNQEELESFFDVQFTKDEHVVYYSKRIIEMGVTYVIVSQGAEGVMIVAKDWEQKIPALKLKVKSTVGAGDSMVAAIAAGLEKAYRNGAEPDEQTMADIVAYGAAASSASIEQEGTIMGELDRIEELYKKIAALRKDTANR